MPLKAGRSGVRWNLVDVLGKLVDKFVKVPSTGLAVGNVLTISGTSPLTVEGTIPAGSDIREEMDVTAVAGATYILGEQAAVTIALPTEAELGKEISVVFYSGSVATALIVSDNIIGEVPTIYGNHRVELSFMWDGKYWSLISNTVEWSDTNNDKTTTSTIR